MTRYLPWTVAALFLFSGIVHGLWTDRWTWTDEPGASAAKLDQIPMTLGDWQGQPVDMATQPPGVVGHLCRHYVHARTRSTVTLVIVTGRPGPACIHTPDACYVASGYKHIRQERHQTAGDQPAELWTAPFWKDNTAEQRSLRIYWAWNATGAWKAPDHPRLTFARYPVLHKMYLIRETAAPGESTENDACLEFLRDFQPVFHRLMFES